MGNYMDSAGAFVEALKLDPKDQDAKHNLELALKKLKQQQSQSNSNQKKQGAKDPDQSQASSGKDGGQPQPKDARNESGSRKEQDRPLKQQTLQQIQREGSMNKEQAAQILDAVRNQELEQQRKLLESRARRKTNEKDW
jgi:Ca-activated chloride channel family protein